MDAITARVLLQFGSHPLGTTGLSHTLWDGLASTWANKGPMYYLVLLARSVPVGFMAGASWLQRLATGTRGRVTAI